MEISQKAKNWTIVWSRNFTPEYVAQMAKKLSAVPQSLISGSGTLEKGMATHSSILAWRLPWTEELGGLCSMGSERVRHDWVTFTFTLYTHMKKPVQKDTCISMFISVLVTVENIRNYPIYPSSNEWIKKMWHMCIYIYIYRERESTIYYTHTHMYNGILQSHKKE